MSFVWRQLTPARLFTVICALTLLWGYHTPLTELITPERGLGYALGIVGASMMLLVVIYPARKRIQSLAFVGTVPFWFRTHVVLGVVGPILVLFHSKFSLGATNSNVALYCMLLVSGSGIVGRYFYSRVYDQFLGRQATAEEVRSVADVLRSQGTTVTVLPHVLEEIEREEKALLAPARGALGRLVHPVVISIRAAVSRRHLRRLIHARVVEASRTSRPVAAQAARLEAATFAYAGRRLDAQRRVAEYRLYANLFSHWHILHVPLFILLIIAALVHIVSVNVY